MLIDSSDFKSYFYENAGFPIPALIAIKVLCVIIKGFNINMYDPPIHLYLLAEPIKTEYNQNKQT